MRRAGPHRLTDRGHGRAPARRVLVTHTALAHAVCGPGSEADCTGLRFQASAIDGGYRPPGLVGKAKAGSRRSAWAAWVLFPPFPCRRKFTTCAAHHRSTLDGRGLPLAGLPLAGLPLAGVCRVASNPGATVHVRAARFSAAAPRGSMVQVEERASIPQLDNTTDPRSCKYVKARKPISRAYVKARKPIPGLCQG